MGRAVTKKYPYKGTEISMTEILALPECTKSRHTVRNGLIAGKTVAEILAPDKPIKPKKIHSLSRWHIFKGCQVTVNQYMELSGNPYKKSTILKKIAKGATLDEIEEAYIESLPAITDRERFKKIMSVPVNPKYTQVYYMKQTPLGNDGTVEPVRLKQNGFII